MFNKHISMDLLGRRNALSCQPVTFVPTVLDRWTASVSLESLAFPEMIPMAVDAPKSIGLYSQMSLLGFQPCLDYDCPCTPYRDTRYL